MRVEGRGFRVPGFGFRVYDLGFGVGLSVEGFEHNVYCPGFKVTGFKVQS